MPLKIYYIDDEICLCENFFDTFSTDGVSILTFTDPSTAIKAIKEKIPDLLFIDYRFPGTTGDEVARQVNLNIPTFLITGDFPVTTSHKFTRIISKPYATVEIAKLIEHYSNEKKAKAVR